MSQPCRALLIFLVNPMKQVPAIALVTFVLFESHAILRYLLLHFWKLLIIVGYIFNTILAPAFGLPMNPQAAAEGQKLLSASLAMIDTFWLQKDGSFLNGNSQPSLADLSLVCEIMKLECLDEKDRDSILSPHKNVLKWIDDIKSALVPHFDEIHATLFKVKEMFEKKRSAGASS